jgi:hypothetical protein
LKLTLYVPVPTGAVSVQGVVQLSLPKLASAPAGTDVTCTGVPDVPPPLKLGILKLGKLKLGMLGSAPHPERAAQLSTMAIARRIMIVPPQALMSRNCAWHARAAERRQKRLASQ